ncbi:alpha-N-acetylglucosaminidase [Kitasatospora viridis]|uniref:alpha-N-acetylglucosaminidase n=1 Tax=Kitasatospora viridis TaxID=281105 RepID=UPI0011A8641D|nr:alpha-N-acetylglucosaminidase [Kitasatospora viridis]
MVGGRLGLAGCCAVLLAALCPGAARASEGFDPAPAVAALGRLLPAAQARQFTLLPGGPAHGYTVTGPAGAITVRADGPADLLAGAGWYLERVAGVDIGLPGDSLAGLPAVLPAVPGGAATRTATVPHRYALNDTDAGYSGPYRDFAAYQHEIDVLALHGINEVYLTVGAEYPYYQALKQFGYRAEELRAWIPAPAHQPWWLLQNLAGFGGPVSEQLLDARAALGRKLAGRLRELGITPVLPGYFGTVPPGFAERTPDAVTVSQGDWVHFDRPDWLDPTCPAFARLAAAYYRAQREQFGDSTLYKMDPMHEGGRSGGVDVTAAARAVQQALAAAHPDATWVLLGWEDNPTTAELAGTDPAHLLVLDGVADRYDGLDRERQWGGARCAFGSIPNFGGHTALGANTGVWADRFARWRDRPGSALAGLAWLPEATGNNPAAFELFTELAWQPGTLDQQAWFADYADRRYGRPDPHARAAWELLRQGPYGTGSGRWSEPQDSVIAARPSLEAGSAAAWSPAEARYDPATVRRALTELLQVAPELRVADAYRYDLVELARQTLDDRARALLPAIAAAYRDQDTIEFTRLTDQWRRGESLLERLLATDPRFLLGRWTAAARGWAADPAEADRLEYDARSLLTTWGGRGPSELGPLHDYANREWSGLVADVYAPRWDAYFRSLQTAMATGADPAPIDWFTPDDDWAHRTGGYPTSPTGDPVALATEVGNLP